MSNKKPEYIEAIYSQALIFDLEDLEIDWDNVKDYWIKYATLYVEYKNGNIEDYECTDEPEIDWKYPTSQGLYDKDWSEVSDDK